MKNDRPRSSLIARPAAPAITSAIAALLLYAVTLGGTYIYDDVPIVRDDARVRERSQWGQLWTRDYFNGGTDNLYRPLVSSSYAAEWWLHGNRPWVFHLVNVLLHAAVAAAVAEVTRRGLKGSSSAIPAAYIAGVLFAVHPLHVEAVANIVGRAELACALAIFAGLALLARRPLTTRRAVAILSCGVVGVLCKEQGILQPLLWIFFGWFIWWDRATVLVSLPQSPVERRAFTMLTLLTVWLWAGYLIGREHFLKFDWDTGWLDPMRQPMLRSFGLDRALMPIVLIGHYTALLVWPAHLSLDYGGDVIGSHVRRADRYLWIGWVAVLSWCAAVVFARRRRAGFVVFSLLSMAITYGVVGNIITLIGTNFAERLVYLPSAFLLMAVAATLAELPIKPRAAIVAVVVLLSSVKTFTAAADWNDPLILYQHSLAATPKSIQAYLLLSNEYRDRGNVAASDAALAKVCEIYPDYWRVWMHRSIAAMDDGNLHAARQYLDRAIGLDGNPVLIGVQSRLMTLEAKAHPPGLR